MRRNRGYLRLQSSPFCAALSFSDSCCASTLTIAISVPKTFVSFANERHASKSPKMNDLRGVFSCTSPRKQLCSTYLTHCLRSELAFRYHFCVLDYSQFSSSSASFTLAIG